jgi:hypothetical protein
MNQNSKWINGSPDKFITEGPGQSRIQPCRQSPHVATAQFLKFRTFVIINIQYIIVA